MTEPPKLEHLIASAAEMEQLLAGNADVQKLIDGCRVRPIEVRENLALNLRKQTISRFLHPTSEYEVAVISHYERMDGSKYSVISRLRIGDTVHELEIPQ
jgi:hypothetical protein